MGFFDSGNFLAPGFILFVKFLSPRNLFCENCRLQKIFAGILGSRNFFYGIF